MEKIIGKISGVIFLVFSLFLLSGCNFGSVDGGFYKSSDEGKTFKQFSGEKEGVNLIGKNILSMEIDENNPEEILVGTESSGVYLTENGGETWLKDNSPFTKITSIEKIPGENLIYISAVKEGRGKILKTTNQGKDWEEIYTEKKNGPYVTFMAVDPENPKVIYIANTKGGIFKTVDGGESWRNLEWIKGSVRKIEFDTGNSDLIYFASDSSGLLRTENSGDKFEKVLDEDVYNAVADPSNSGVIYASTQKGLKRSADKGEEWETLNTLTKPEELSSYGLAINPLNSSEIYYASGKAFYKSVNGGDTWTPIQFNINASIDIIKVNLQNSSIIYLGTKRRGSGLDILPPGL